MQIKIPNGVEINKLDNNIIKIKVPNTKFWVQGEQQTRNTWHAYLVDPESNTKELIKKDATTKSFAMFSSVILKTPFPYKGKRGQNIKSIIRFLNNII